MLSLMPTYLKMWAVIVSILFLHRFTCLAVCLFQVREFLGKLDELTGKVSYTNDPIKIKKPALQQRTDKLLHDLLERSPVHGHTNHPPLLLCNCRFILYFFLFSFSFKLLCGWESAVNASRERSSGAPDKCPIFCQDQVSVELQSGGCKSVSLFFQLVVVTNIAIGKALHETNYFLHGGSEWVTEPDATMVV